MDVRLHGAYVHCLLQQECPTVQENQRIMKKSTGQIVFFSCSLLFFLYCLVSSICNGDKTIAIILAAIMVVLNSAQLYLVCKGKRLEDDKSKE